MGGIPPSSAGSSPFGFHLGGKNHLGNQLQLHIKEYRDLMSEYPKDFHKLENFLEKKLTPFLKEKEGEIAEQCKNNGWSSEGAYNFKAELETASTTIQKFLTNPHDGERPLFKLNEAITQVHFFLVNSSPS